MPDSPQRVGGVRPLRLSDGRLMVVLAATSFPRITGLFGTVFTIPVSTPAASSSTSTTISSPVASTSGSTQGATTEVSFNSNVEVSLALTSTQSTLVQASESTLSSRLNESASGAGSASVSGVSASPDGTTSGSEDDTRPAGEGGRLEQSTDEVLSQLSSEERFLLASYFLDGRTLAEIARSMGVHESTISRKLDKLTTSVRKRIRDDLVRRGMSRAQAEELLSTDVRDVAINVRESLGRGIAQNERTQATPSQTFSMKEKIVSEGIRGKDL